MAKLEKIALMNNYDYVKPHAYLNKDGFDVTIEETYSNNVFIFYILLSNISTQKAQELLQHLKLQKKAFKVFSYQISGLVLKVVWNGYFTSLNAPKMEEFIFSIIQLIKSLSIEPNNVCSFCGEEGADELVYVNGIRLLKAHSECKKAKIEEYRESQKNKPVEKPNYVGGVIGALFGAVIGIIPWIIVELSLGFLAAVLALLVGYSSFFMYKKFGGPLNKNAKIIVSAATVLGVILTNLFFASYIIYIADGALVFENYIIVYTTPETNLPLFQSLFIGLVMCGFALPTLIVKIKNEENKEYQLQ